MQHRSDRTYQRCQPSLRMQGFFDEFALDLELRDAGRIAEDGRLELELGFDAAFGIGGGNFRHDLVKHR
jgi:hypothetical protein